MQPFTGIKISKCMCTVCWNSHRWAARNPMKCVIICLCKLYLVETQKAESIVMLCRKDLVYKTARNATQSKTTEDIEE